MKHITHFIAVVALCLSATFQAAAQYDFIDSSRAAFQVQKPDTNKVKNGINISYSYVVFDPDSALVYAQRCLDLSKKLQSDYFTFYSETAMAEAYSSLGNYPQELTFCFQARALANKIGTPEVINQGKELLSNYYYNLGEYRTSLKYVMEIKQVCDRYCPESSPPIWLAMSRIYEGMSKPDSAIYFAGCAKNALDKKTYHFENWQIVRMQSMGAWLLGNAYSKQNRYDSALYWYRFGLPVSAYGILKLDLAEGWVGAAAAFRKMGQLDSAIHYARLAMTDTLSRTYRAALLKALSVMAGIYESANKPDSALKYLKLADRVKDDLFNREKMAAIQTLTNEEQERQKRIEADSLRVSNRYGILLLLAAFIAVSLAALVVLRWQRLKQLQKMRNSIADDLHDDIGSTLSSISIMSELAKVKSPEALPLLTSIEENAISLQENMSDIVWAVNPKNDRFENVFQRMNEFGSSILEARQISFEFRSDASLDATKLSMTQRKNLYLFFKEAINNAAKYSGARRVSVTVTRQDNRVVLQIRDDGCGFDTATKVNGHGMLTLKKRREELGGQLHIDSSPGAGTAVDLKFRIT